MKKLAIILTITALGLHIKGQEWVQSNGPEGGAISEMVCTDNDKTVMAKVSNVEKTMFTTDYGDNWEKETVNSPGTLINFHEAGGVLFAYAQGIDNPKKFYRSADGGKNWSEISDLPDYYHGKVFEHDGALYGALGKNGNLNVFKSTDKGVTWTDMNSTGFSYGGAKFIFPSDSMLIAIEGKDAFYSEDNGKTFTKSTDLGEHVDEYFVHNGTAYLGQFNEKAIYYSEDDGKTWQEQAMTIDPSGFFSFKGNLYAIGDDNIFIMESHGATLTPVFGPELEGISVASATKGGSVAWLATTQGVLRSTDGLNWTFANKGLGYASINAFDILNGDTYFMASEAGVWRSKSYGERWIPKGLLAKTVIDVQVANSKVYAAAHKDLVYVSDDEGETWSTIGTGFPADALSPTLATDGSHLYCHVEQGAAAGVYKLTNFTGNWEKVLDNTSSLVIWANDTLILTGEKYSKDQGASWSDIKGLEGSKGSVNPESYVTTSNGDFYAGAFRKVAGNPAAFESNNGTNFSIFDDGIVNNTQSVVGLLNRNDTIYASSYVYIEGNDNNDNHTYYLVPGESTWTEFGYASIKDVPVGRGAFVNTPYGILLGSVKGVFRYDIETIPEVPDTVDQIEYPEIDPVDVSLKSLTAGSETLDPSFSADNLNYTVELATGTTTVPTVSAEANDDSATVDITQAENVDGTQSERTATIVVTGKDGETTRTYTVLFYVKPALGKDATLSSLEVSQGTLNPSFSSAVENYTVTLPEGTTETPTVTAETNDANATKDVDQATNITGPEAERTATVVVTSEDETTTITYSVVFSVETGTPVNDIKENITSIYPNPTSATLTIQSDIRLDEIVLYSITGKKVMQFSSAKKETVLDVSGLDNGMYIIQTNDINGNINTRKIIKQ